MNFQKPACANLQTVSGQAKRILSKTKFTFMKTRIIQKWFKLDTRISFAISYLILITSCNGQVKSDTKTEQIVFPSNGLISKNDDSHFGLQDKLGRLWFGTTVSGLYSYNGTTFTHFSVNDGINETCVFSILEDKLGVIWIGTSNGLYKYNGTNFQKVAIPHSYIASKPDAMGNVVYNPDCILSILQDKNGNIWFGSMGFGVYKFDGNEFSFFLPSKEPNYNLVQCIIEDKTGTLFFGTRGEGIWTYNGIEFKNFKSKTVNNNHLLDILETENGDLWFSVVGGGVRHYTNRTNSEFVAYDGEIFQDFTQKDNSCFLNVFSMLQDKNGNLWFASDGGGVCMYNGKYYTNFSTENGLCSNAIRGLLEDDNGNIWFGTRRGGLCSYDGKSFTDFTDKLNK